MITREQVKTVVRDAIESKTTALTDDEVEEASDAAAEQLIALLDDVDLEADEPEETLESEEGGDEEEVDG